MSLGECENGAAVVEKLAREHGCLGRVSTLPANGIQHFLSVFRIHRIHVFFGLPDPDPLVRGMDPDPSIIM